MGSHRLEARKGSMIHAAAFAVSNALIFAFQRRGDSQLAAR